jgi:WD40 repeat protein
MSEQVDENGNTYYLEEVEVDDDEPDQPYQEVDEEFDDDEEEDFGSMLKSMKKQDQEDAIDVPSVKQSKGSRVERKAAVVDDFIRNFLIKLNMTRTLDVFNTEWYELTEQGKLNDEDVGVVADIYQRNAELDESVKRLRREVSKSHTIADKARGTWDKFRKERDFHRMHHRRVVQEKNILIRDMKRLKKHYQTFEPALLAMRAKYETAMKDKMLMKLEKDRAFTKVSALEKQIKSYETMRMEEAKTGEAMPMAIGGAPEEPRKKKKSGGKKKNKTLSENGYTKHKSSKRDTPYPVPSANPHTTRDYPPMNFEKMQLRKTFRGHKSPISGMAIHPTKEIVATTSDDWEWKMWALPRGELIMSGTGHKDWVGACKFHPRGHILSTASGDGTVKLWDFNQAKCSATFADHTQAVWDCAFNDDGDFLVSGSMDQTARLWDVATSKCRQTLRGHVDAVNSICFQPFSPNVCTGSGDKTVSLWDIRCGLCIQTFYGHENAVLSTAFSLQGDTIASSDSDGVIKVWDVRTVSERCTINVAETNQAVNTVQFDRSGQSIIAGSDLGLIHVFGLTADGHEEITKISGPEGAVQAIALDPKGTDMLSAGSDHALRLFS